MLLVLVSSKTVGQQLLPAVCEGDKVRYAVKGLNESSFSWNIDSLAGSITHIYDNGDSIEVTFKNNPGTYKIYVSETSKHGCISPGSEYIVNVNNRIQRRDTSLFLCNTNETFNLNDLLYNDEFQSAGIWYNDNGHEVIDGINLNGGNHKFYYRDDSNKCQEPIVASITVDSGLFYISDVIKQNVKCFGQSNGLIKLKVKGGADSAGYYYYDWDDGLAGWNEYEMNGIFIDSGSYSKDFHVAIFDSIGCRIDTSITLSQPDSIYFYSEEIYDAYCPDVNDGAIHVDIAGGVAPYLFEWSNSYDGRYNENLYPGVYNLRLTDKNECIKEKSYVLNTENEVCFEIPTVFSPNTDGHNDEWVIPYFNQYFPEGIVYVFDRWGKMVFKSQKGYPESWDGRFRNRDLPIDSYHYIIETDKKQYTGNVTIIR